MSRIEITTDVRALPEICFDLSRDLDLHVRSLHSTSERAVAGKTSGLLEAGEQVTWQGRHFGLMLQHTARITEFDRPRHFRDQMIKGHFAVFNHDHYFEPMGGVTRMRDVLEFRSPLGVLGWIVDSLVLTRYLTNLLRRRNAVIKQAAEAEGSSGGAS